MLRLVSRNSSAKMQYVAVNVMSGSSISVATIWVDPVLGRSKQNKYLAHVEQRALAGTCSRMGIKQEQVVSIIQKAGDQ